MESPQINSDSDYRRALVRADVLMYAAPGTAEYQELRALAPLIEAWSGGNSRLQVARYVAGGLAA